MADEQLYGKEGIEHDAGYTPIPEPSPAKSEEIEATEALQKWSDNREQEAKPIIDRSYIRTDGDDIGKPYPEAGTVSAERAAQDLADIRAAEKALTESVESELLGNDIDIARRHGEGQSVRAQADAQPAEQQPQQTEQTQHSDGLDGVDPEVAAAFRNPKILNVLSQHYSAAEAKVAAAQTQAEAQTSAAIQQAAQWAQTNAELAAAAILVRPELQGVHPSQIPGALQALATANPQAAAQIQQQLNHAQALVQQTNQAKQVQQQRQSQQFQQAALQHDAEFDRLSAASGETPEQRDAVARYAHKMLKDSGLTDEFISHHWNNNPLMRSVQGQQILHDAAAFRMLRAGIPNKIAPTPVPRVNRPGSSMDRPAAADRDSFALEQRFQGPLSAKEAAQLVIGRRARSNR